jgi:hypothetical protein
MQAFNEGKRSSGTFTQYGVESPELIRAGAKVHPSHTMELLPPTARTDNPIIPFMIYYPRTNWTKKLKKKP